jgi:hypothetical protein
LSWIGFDNQKYERKGREKHLEKQEKWKQFLPTPSKRVYTLLSLMRARSEERDA